MDETSHESVRINKYLADKGIASRREADRIISQGNVTINGRRAALGDRVFPKDKVEIKGSAKDISQKYVYYIYNKPRGIVSTNAQYDYEKEIADMFETSEKVAVMGRLDKESEGLVLLSNDGRLSHRLLSPEFHHEKEYKVKVTQPLKDRVVRIFAKGMTLEGDEVKGAEAKIISEKTLNVILTEGKRHQIRRMLSALGYEVVSLTRVRIMNIRLGNLNTGEGRKLTSEETLGLLQGLKLQ